MEQVEWKVEGMTCSNCALSVNKFLQKEGLADIKVNPLDGAVSFTYEKSVNIDRLKKGIGTLGYKLVTDDDTSSKRKRTILNLLTDAKARFLFTLPFTFVLMLHMLHPWLPLNWLMNADVQLALCIPVFITGMWFFGRSAIKSLRNGMPNMDVLITVGAIASFSYSLTGLVLRLGENYLFFETTASIITLVFMGNYLENVSMQSTQSALKSLAKTQKVMANMIAFDDKHEEQVFLIENTFLKTGDLVLVKNGEQVPADCKILWGDCSVNEAIVTGESLPVSKQKKDFLIGGSVLDKGLVKAQVTASGKDTVLAGIIKLVKQAQSEKPPMQKLADRISAVFVPSVIGIAVITYLVNYFVAGENVGESLMRSIAVLVISCPCAMGLATPAALAVGLGRAARSGIVFRKASSLESFRNIKQVVFDKTGTLTTGTFIITDFHTSISEEDFKRIVFSLEKYSSHPLGKAITNTWKTKDAIQWKKFQELKGIGVTAEDSEGNIFEAGSYKIAKRGRGEKMHDVVITKNASPIGWLDMTDEIRPEAKEVIGWLRARNIKTILLSGDRQEKCEQIAKELNIDEVFGEQSPNQKMDKITALNVICPTAMVGDGINDAPALAQATLGISLSDASQVAMQSADVVLMNHGIKNLPNALGLGKHTFITIKQNLFWAFAYNVVAIPIAATGLLSPTVAALAMGFSDIILGVNSLRLSFKKII